MKVFVFSETVAKFLWDFCENFRENEISWNSAKFHIFAKIEKCIFVWTLLTSTSVNNVIRTKKNKKQSMPRRPIHASQLPGQDRRQADSWAGPVPATSRNISVWINNCNSSISFSFFVNYRADILQGLRKLLFCTWHKHPKPSWQKKNFLRNSRDGMSLVRAQLVWLGTYQVWLGLSRFG
jgi:hypothetical protein